MTDSWYEVIGSQEPLSQGDLLIDCPLIAWKPGPLADGADADPERLKASATAERADVVVMTQACDLEQKKVDRVVVCIADALDAFRVAWVEKRKSKRQEVGQ